MILFNITIIIEEAINQEWLDWMNENFIPKALETKFIVSHRLLKVIGSPNEGITYCLQFIIDNIGYYQEFQENLLPELMKMLSAKFENRFVSFSTLMEFVD